MIDAAKNQNIQFVIKDESELKHGGRCEGEKEKSNLCFRKFLRRSNGRLLLSLKLIVGVIVLWAESENNNLKGRR